MSQYKMENACASAVINEHVSEITSFKSQASDREYMWQGDPAYWSGRNPTLFPMVGSTWDGLLHIGGKSYKTGNHGFARHADFTCISHDADHVVMQLKNNAETMAQYPFHFTLENHYHLTGSTLSIQTVIINENDGVMPFNFGYHPAFNLPIEERTDYRIQFSSPESFISQGIAYDHITSLPIDMSLLKKTIIIPDPKSSDYILTNGVHGVTVHAPDYPWIAFWSKDAPFVCIEPWHSHTDFKKTDVPFEKREGTILLEPGKRWKTEYSITVF